MAEQSGINVGPDTSGMAGPLPSEEQFNAHVLAVARKEHALPSVGKESTLDVELKVRVDELFIDVKTLTGMTTALVSREIDR